MAGEVIKTPGSESNVKEIFDKCWELKKSGQELMIFNQFEEFGNYLWHYEVTGHAMEEALKNVMGKNDRFRGVASATGSGGTIASGDYLKQIFPESKIIASEALQCPTLSKTGSARTASKASATSTCPKFPQRQEQRAWWSLSMNAADRPSNDPPVQRAGRLTHPAQMGVPSC